ncbi:uncharacterized protein Z520_02951 [Fonsecaea multimorphosa CBS 102226]|uniref:Fe2OG dioxygenase domain-containing protein n=1 Tax=Fonsecaea multimorphosa CBS 102226 TaxID=1442371 RepID=A0A0D2KX56_9EURO|nr:uncharacterized protein Z520_02951 [Fonsecaea multimorphosa CBS 102226]KIY01399.1 hypothetical protein Z520_02951 [Fonsecaea multimorphosa CBS 102226]OAL28417.1 hypothetical protein AYO22_02871 [Fonsecaea multimorphosa]
MASLEIIKYQGLLEGEREEIDRLVNACRTMGIFYLDMTASDPFTDLQKVYDASARYFNQTAEAKQADFVPGLERGFKQYTGSSTFEIPKDERDGVPVQLPSTLRDVSVSLSRLSSACDAACRLMLSQLGDSLGQRFPECAPECKPTSKPEQTGLKLCHKEPSETETQTNGKAHTDSGLLTLLFYDQPTLQISAETKEGGGDWLTVEPRAGSAVVNVADELQNRTDGELHSPLHRVIQPAGVCKERLSAVYFLRPEK